MTVIITFILAAFAMIAYWLPTLVAMHAKKKDVTAIFVLNTLLGWSLIGWIIALVWAVKKDAPKQ